jgi:hypothetical protein
MTSSATTQQRTDATTITLADLADAPRWVAWRQELRRNKDGEQVKTKIPYDPRTGRLARIPTEPSTWNTRAKAEWRWQRLHDAEHEVGGVGIVLGELEDGDYLMGIDLDGCINPKTNQLRRWAQEIIERFDTYTEISPSGRGAKLFFRMPGDNFAEVKLLMGGKTRKPFVASPHKEIALDRARYYAVTDDRLENVPETLRLVSVEEVRWLLQEAGPQFLARLGKQQQSQSSASHKQDERDESDSGHGRRFFEERKREGDNYQQARAAILDDPGRAGDWARKYTGEEQERQFRRAWEAARAPHDKSGETRPLVARSIDQFEERALEWLWFPFFPKGMVTLLSGDKGTGKSSVLLDLAARISKGAALPRFGDDAEELVAKGSVIILCQEDDIPRLIRPRLKLAGADLSRIHTVGYEVPDDPKEFDLIERLDTTVKQLEALVEQIGNVMLIIIDPITDYVGDRVFYNETEVRKLLRPLVRLASRHNLSIVNVIHFNKKADLPVKYRTLGAGAFRNVAKSSVIYAKNPDVGGPEFYMAQEISNLTAGTRAVAYSMYPIRGYHRVDWGSEREDVDINDLLADKRPSKQQKAEQLLREWLADGPVAVKELEQRAQQHGIKWRNMQRAKKDIGVSAHKGAKGWTWRLDA